MREKGQADNDLLARLAGDERLGLPPGALDGCWPTRCVHRRRDARRSRPSSRGSRRSSPPPGRRRVHPGGDPVKLLHSGKVRDVLPRRATATTCCSSPPTGVSIYDVVLPTPIPDKGAVLTQLSLWWFDRLADLVPNHVISATDVPAEFAGRALRCRRLRDAAGRVHRPRLPDRARPRGVREARPVSGVALPAGLVEGSRLPEPIFTPTTKAPVRRARRVHDVRRGRRPWSGRTPRPAAARADPGGLRARRGDRGGDGILVADTKLEFGRDPDGAIVLADEVLTPDSSRFWPADGWAAGPAAALVRQAVRARLVGGPGWDRTPPGPGVPAGGGRRDPRPLRRGLRTDHRPALAPPDHPCLHVLSACPRFPPTRPQRHASLTSSRVLVVAPRLQWSARLLD